MGLKYLFLESCYYFNSYITAFNSCVVTAPHRTDSPDPQKFGNFCSFLFLSEPTKHRFPEEQGLAPSAPSSVPSQAWPPPPAQSCSFSLWKSHAGIISSFPILSLIKIQHALNAMLSVASPLLTRHHPNHVHHLFFIFPAHPGAHSRHSAGAHLNCCFL